MAYFSKAFLQFFKDLSANNNSEWFADNRPVYEKEVKKPFLALVTDLIGRCQIDEPELTQLPKDAIFRINRDIRFSNDKRPYKEHVSALISRHGKKSNLPGFYFQLGAGNAWIGGGAYELDKDKLNAVRQEIFYNGAEFNYLLQEADFKRFYNGQLLGERNKILPAPYKEAVADEPYLANKQFYYMVEMPTKDLALRDDLLEVLYQYRMAGHGVNRFLEVAMTPDS